MPFGSKKNSKMKNLPAVLILGVLLSTQMCVTNGGKLQACLQKNYVCTDAPNCLQLRQTWPTITAYHETNPMLCGVKCLNFTLKWTFKRCRYSACCATCCPCLWLLEYSDCIIQIIYLKNPHENFSFLNEKCSFIAGSFNSAFFFVREEFSRGLWLHESCSYKLKIK